MRTAAADIALAGSCFSLLGGFLLPLQMVFPAAPALLALTVLLFTRVQAFAKRPEIWLFMLAWTLFFPWNAGSGGIAILIDLALAGPILAFASAGPVSFPLKTGLVHGGVFAALVLLAQGIFGQHVPLSWLGSVWTWPRAAGCFYSPNTAGAFLAALIPLVLGGDRRRWITRLICIILGAACLATGSRAAWLASWTGVAAYLWFRRSPLLLSWWLMAAFFLVLPWPPGERFLVSFAGDTAVSARLALWRGFLSGWLRSPWIGRGLASNPHPHNMLLEMAIAGGLPVLACWFLPAFRAAKLLLARPARRDTAAAGASLAALAVYGLADAILAAPVLYSLFWLDYGWIIARDEDCRN